MRWMKPKINMSNTIQCVLVSGVAGNDTDGYCVKTQYLHRGNWVEVLFNGQTKTILPSKDQVVYRLHHDTVVWSDLPDIPEEKYVSAAIRINEVLHNAGH